MLMLPIPGSHIPVLWRVNFRPEPTFDQGHFSEVKLLPGIATLWWKPGVKKWVELSQNCKPEILMEPKNFVRTFQNFWPELIFDQGHFCTKKFRSDIDI
jgi:hypothetical protein